MDVSSSLVCDDKLDMLKTTSRIDPKLNAAMVDGRRFSAADRSVGPSRLKSNFVVVPRCRPKGLGDICLSASERSDTTESRELPRDLKVPESPSSDDHSQERHSEHVHGTFHPQTLPKHESARRRTFSNSPSEHESFRRINKHHRKRTYVSGDRNAESGNSNSVQYRNGSTVGDCSDGGNILSKMYASFGHESSHTTNRYLPNSKLVRAVKSEPNFDEHHIPAKRTKRDCNNELSNATGSHYRKTSEHDTRRSCGSATPPPTQQPSSRYPRSSSPRNHPSSQRKRLHGRTNNDRHHISKKPKISQELIRNYRPHKADSPSEYPLTSQDVADRVTSQSRPVDDNNCTSSLPHLINRKYPYITDQTPESILHLPNYSFMHDQVNMTSSFGMSGIGYHHDPNLLLKSASLGAGTINPFLLGVNACVMNPFLMSSLEQSEIMAAAAYRQAIATQILKSRMAGVKPLLGLGLMDSTSSIYGGLSNIMYGFPDSAHLPHNIGSAFRVNASELPINTHHTHKAVHTDLTRTRKKPLIQNEKSPESYHPEVIHSSGTDPENERVSSPPHGVQHHHSPRSLPSIKDAFRRLSHPAVLKSSLDADESDNIERSRIDHPNNLLPRTKARSADFGTRRSIDQDIVAESSVKLPAELPHAMSVKRNDATVEDKSSLADEKTFSRNSTYKNLTRERRLVANARERTRVHTISSAFEELRGQIPSYSCNQKLSKLAILRIACSYIQSLSVLAGRNTEGTFKESVDQCTGVLQAESKARCRRKNTKAQVEWEMESYEKSTLTSSAVNMSGSTRQTTSPRTLEYWRGDRLVNDTGDGDSSSNDSDPLSPSHNTNEYDAERENKQHETKQGDSSFSADETMTDFSPINVDD